MPGNRNAACRVGLPLPEHVKMPRVSAFHSIFESRKPPYQRVYHDNDACPLGRDISERERQTGSGGHRECIQCERLNKANPGPNRWL